VYPFSPPPSLYCRRRPGSAQVLAQGNASGRACHPHSCRGQVRCALVRFGGSALQSRQHASRHLGGVRSCRRHAESSLLADRFAGTGTGRYGYHGRERRQPDCPRRDQPRPDNGRQNTSAVARRNVAYDISRHRRFCENARTGRPRAAKRSRSCRRPAKKCLGFDVGHDEPAASGLAVLSNALRRGERCFSPPGSVRRRDPMRSSCMCIALAAFSLGAMAVAQPQREDRKSDDSPWSTGRTVLLDNKGQLQPQGWAGPLSTGTGGAPATSPQGGTPPDMQPAPGGATKTIVDPHPADSKACDGCTEEKPQ